ncbi:MAG TPA: RyR domain-containing protein [Syntrophomonadaceae bacterium]|nr:RyR domain-containing protein [Syntrophomonadaceae bacterium]HPR94593.1 RyR domain-containing protein [Syntrophomonadaceae bacterium]
MAYKPEPINTSSIQLNDGIKELTELLAENAHDIWALQRMSDGWVYGRKRNDEKKEHPCLIAYEQLPEAEKEYDRKIAMETIKVIIALGYRIEKA